MCSSRTKPTPHIYEVFTEKKKEKHSPLWLIYNAMFPSTNGLFTGSPSIEVKHQTHSDSHELSHYNGDMQKHSFSFSRQISFAKSN